MGIIARQSIKGTIVTYLGVAIGFLTTFMVLTRFLTAEEIGLARVLIDAATLFVGLAQMGTNASIIRFFPYFREKRTDKSQQPTGKAGLTLSSPEDGLNSDHGFWLWAFLFPLLGFLLFALIFVACRVPLGQWFGEKSPLFVEYYYFVLPMAFFMLYQVIAETGSNVMMRIVVPRTVREVIVRIGLLACYLLYALHYLSMDGFVIALCANYGIAALINIVYLFAYGQISLRPDIAFLRANRPIVRNYILYTCFLIASALASVLAPTLSSFFITAQMGLNYTGVFAIATYIAVMVSIPYRSLAAIASPQLADAIKDERTTEITGLFRQVVNNTLLVGVIIFLTIWINIDLIFHLLPNGATYAVARNTVFILALSQLIMGTFSFVLCALNFSRYYIYSLLFSVILTGSSIVLNNYLIPLYGMNGAAMSNLLSYAIYFVLITITVMITMRSNPLSRNFYKIIILFVTLLAINYLWQRYLPIANIWLSSVLRTIVLVGGAAVYAWFGHLSPEINALLRSLFVQRH